ncbi:hypothetical protein ACM01_33810 [Streptomyces viridochromogenes]|uniref:ESX-1 secretion-associated protein n=1 Tax=Streptomyces viridochromogenes TaxID=1938 RepID=A0A0J7Z273_STRVR|nr:hypothetical protein [Streptomyces viridochromogenes]KMS69727.1 hypothetical protein ACM01_33810 [Streptomyces viridochromogenes]KOG14949.1 hypothetical protein ADK36_30625 [Streptomyces viridochromogenes]KOG15142.1 hypothetical protein ADK35_30270 [Streptomyces viridochromogenes]
MTTGSQAGGFSARAESVDGSSHLLNELAGLLYAGRMDGENATQCRVPRSHPQVAEAVSDFARYAQDQYGDLVTLLSALSTKLQATGNAYVKADAGAQRAMDDLLDKGRYVAPEDR